MTPQGQQPGAPAPQQGWFSRNWKWLVGVGCLGVAGCCGLFTLAGYVMNEAGVEAPGEVKKEAEREAQKAANPPGGQGPIVKLGALDGARVDCGQPGPGGVDCEVKRTSGDGKLKACWDLDITCDNGGVMSAHGCGTLGAGEPRGTVNMPVSAFSNQDACDVPTSGAVKNLVVQSVE
ncbi:MAG: hypothetical protein AB1730_06670 [Myxococcota bacterium]|jgi:hypothetical protein